MTDVESRETTATRISDLIVEIEKWMLITAWDLKSAWTGDFPPLVYPESEKDKEVIVRPYTTAAIYLVRLSELWHTLPTLSPRKPKDIAPEHTNASSKKDLNEVSDELAKFIEAKKGRLRELLREHGLKRKAGPAGILLEALHEGRRIDVRYAAGYLAQAKLTVSKEGEFPEVTERLRKVLRIALGLDAENDDSKALHLSSLFEPRATHANAFLTYLTCTGLLTIDSSWIKDDTKGERGNVIQNVEERTHYLLAKGLVKETAEFDPGELAHTVATRRRLEEQNDHWWLAGAKHDLLLGSFKFVFEDQSEDGLWNAGRPWIYSAEGGALHMISLERANAVLEVLGSQPCVDSDLFERFYDRLDRTYRWLKLTRQQIGAVEGWTSEHSFEYGRRIDYWVNAHALRFLILYREALLRHVEKFVLNHFVQVKRHPSTSWDKLTDPKLGTSETISKLIDEKLPKQDTFEDPHWNYSFLLYGPPGTSKTTTAEAMAKAINAPLVIITSSDFIAQGADAVEAQANRIFRLLMALPRGVVLFDEIDEFIQDRESNRTSPFRFMTTSMLPKLQDLRDRRKVVSVIATNYRERIDLAIKRPPRIELEVLMPPPNSAAREKIARDGLAHIDDAHLRKGPTVEILKNSAPWYSFAELRRLSISILEDKEDVPLAFGSLTKKMVPAASYGIYAVRWKRAGSRKADVENELVGIIETLDLGKTAEKDLSEIDPAFWKAITKKVSPT